MVLQYYTLIYCRIHMSKRSQKKDEEVDERVLVCNSVSCIKSKHSRSIGMHSSVLK
uniref:Uncharacterized protein n=2 Tax=Manihot esculenta TaxID=3983 RepID=A0A2C9UGU5_MANES